MVDAFSRLAEAHGVVLVGGNITRSPGPLMVDVTLTGAVRRRRVLTRSGARPGDDVWVSGEIGAAAAGLESLDAAAFGVSRRPLLVELARQSRVALVLESGRGGLAGFGFARTRSHALYLGPVVANTAGAGLVLVEALIARNPGRVLLWDIPDPNEAGVKRPVLNGPARPSNHGRPRPGVPTFGIPGSLECHAMSRSRRQRNDFECGRYPLWIPCADRRGASRASDPKLRSTAALQSAGKPAQGRPAGTASPTDPAFRVGMCGPARP
jgi:hypothetical protein